MTPAPINSVSTPVTAEANSNTPPSATKPQVSYAPPEDTVDFSWKSQSKLRRYQSTQDDSVSNVHGNSSKTRASSAFVDKVKGSESQRAKVLKAQGEKIQQIAVELNVTPKAIEECLDITEIVDTQGVAGLSTAG